MIYSAVLASAGFLLRWVLLFRSTRSRHKDFSSCSLRPLEGRLSSCAAQTLVPPQYVGSSWTRDQTHVPCIGRQILIHYHQASPSVKIFISDSLMDFPGQKYHTHIAAFLLRRRERGNVLCDSSWKGKYVWMPEDGFL